MLKLFRLFALAFVLLLFVAPATLAQEAEATEEVVIEGEAAAITTEGTPSGNVPGVSAAMLFLGAGAIVVVGLLMIARDNFSGEPEA